MSLTDVVWVIMLTGMSVGHGVNNRDIEAWPHEATPKMYLFPFQLGFKVLTQNFFL